MRLIVIPIWFLYSTVAINFQADAQVIVKSIEEAQKKFSGNRNLTYEYLEDKKYKAVKTILENPIELHLTSGYTESLHSFFKDEMLLILIWIEEYEEMLESLANNIKPKSSINDDGKEQQAIIPYKNTFYSDLLHLTNKNGDVLKRQIKSCSLNSEKKDFLLLYLDYRLVEADLESFEKDSLISRAKDFQKKYPQSIYTNYLIENIDINYKTSDFGLGSSLFIGSYGLTDNLGDNISGGFPIGGLIDLAYKNFVINFHFTGNLSSKVKQNFEYEGIWEKSSRTTLALGCVNLGYSIINNQKMMLTPSIGLASTNISSYIRNEERGFVNLKIDNMPVIHASLSYDYRIKHKTNISEYKDILISEFDKTYWIIRLKVGFVKPDFQDNLNVFRGNMFYAGVGIGIFTYPATSIKQK